MEALRGEMTARRSGRQSATPAREKSGRAAQVAVPPEGTPRQGGNADAAITTGVIADSCAG